MKFLIEMKQVVSYFKAFDAEEFEMAELVERTSLIKGLDDKMDGSGLKNIAQCLKLLSKLVCTYSVSRH
jgi:hypothetical protein